MSASLTTLFALALAMGVAAQSWQRANPSPYAAVAFDPFRDETILFDGATWRLDGTQWRRLPTANAPPPDFQAQFIGPAATAYDLIRQRVVMLTPSMNTWEFDGANWTLATPATSPTARSSYALAYDILRGRVVLFGGGGGRGVTGYSTLFGDTWEYDGANWTQVSATGPSPRWGAACAYDLAHGRVVLFGGDTASLGNPASDTWEYDGTAWHPVTTPSSPAPRRNAVMAHDWNRLRTVLFGGEGVTSMPTDTWEYDGANWTQVAVPVSPPIDPPGSMVSGPSGLRRVAATAIWAFDGFQWTSVADLPSPELRESPGLAHDRARGRTVLFGGQNGGTFHQDTWELDDSHWTLITTPSSPPARSEHAMAYDTARRRIVLFGGHDLAVAPMSDTWTYDGTNWLQLAPATSPAARSGHALANDEGRARLVLFGGRSPGNSFADTWEFDGANWHAIATSAAPRGSNSQALAYDDALGNLVLFCPGSPGETWRFDGTNWTQVTTANPPWFGFNPALVHDPVRGRTLQSASGVTLEFNGANWQAAAPSSFFRGVSVRLAYDARNRRIVQFSSMLDVFQLAPGTWFYDPPVAPTWTRYGAGCAGSNGTPTLDAAPGSVPALGSTFVLQLGSLPLQPGFALLAFGLDVVRWNSALLPVLLDPLGLPGCKAWIAPSADVLVGHGGAAASFAFAIPANPALTGLLVAAQAIVFDPAAAGGVGSVTNGGILSVR